MSDQQTLEELIRRIADLESSLARMGTEKPLFTIKNPVFVDIGSQNNWDVPDVDVVLFENTTTPININGIANGYPGRLLILINPKVATTINIISNSGSASVNNRIYTGPGTNYAMTAGKVAVLLYGYQDTSGTLKWRVISTYF